MCIRDSFSIIILSNCETGSSEKNNTNKIAKTAKQDYLNKGLEIALATQSILGKNLLTAIQNVGTAGALEFCNTRAIPLTDSMAVVLNAQIKRVSDKNRNADNAANQMEIVYINQVKRALKKNGEVKPQLQEMNNKMVGYYPILTNNMCLKCHGNPSEDLDVKTYEVLKDRYPNDKAVGYLANELRGIWVISMEQ